MGVFIALKRAALHGEQMRPLDSTGQLFVDCNLRLFKLQATMHRFISTGSAALPGPVSGEKVGELSRMNFSRQSVPEYDFGG